MGMGTHSVIGVEDPWLTLPGRIREGWNEMPFPRALVQQRL